MMTSQVARKLEGRGLLERRVHRPESRARQVQLTRPGRALVAVALADVEAADERHPRGSRSRRQAFLDALASLDPPSG